jgi:hypothetical protein
MPRHQLWSCNTLWKGEYRFSSGDVKATSYEGLFYDVLCLSDGMLLSLMCCDLVGWFWGLGIWTTFGRQRAAPAS